MKRIAIVLATILLLMGCDGKPDDIGKIVGSYAVIQMGGNLSDDYYIETFRVTTSSLGKDNEEAMEKFCKLYVGNRAYDYAFFIQDENILVVMTRKK